MSINQGTKRRADEESINKQDIQVGGSLPSAPASDAFQQQQKRQKTDPTSTTTSSSSSSTSSSSTSSSTTTNKKTKSVKTKQPPITVQPIEIAHNVTFDTPNLQQAIESQSLRFKVVPETDCGPSYVRNNKRGGLKNLRCYPKCLEKGHNRNGFCGQALEIKLSISAPSFRKAQFVAYGRFTLADPTGQDHDTFIEQYSTYNALSIMNKTRTKDENMLPLYQSTPSTTKHSTDKASKSGSVTFSFSPTSWHYGWRSSKHMKDSAHVFRVYCFIVSANLQLLKCVAITETTWFTLASSKRAKSTGSVDHKTSLVEGGQAEAIQNGAFPTLSLNDLDL